MSFRLPLLRRSFLAAAIVSVFTPAFADAPVSDLDSVVVTATRTAQTQDQTLAAVTVIDREDHWNSQALSFGQRQASQSDPKQMQRATVCAGSIRHA